MKKNVNAGKGRDQPPEAPKKKDSMFGADRWLRRIKKRGLRDERDRI